MIFWCLGCWVGKKLFGIAFNSCFLCFLQILKFFLPNSLSSNKVFANMDKITVFIDQLLLLLIPPTVLLVWQHSIFYRFSENWICNIVFLLTDSGIPPLFLVLCGFQRAYKFAEEVWSFGIGIFLMLRNAQRYVLPMHHLLLFEDSLLRHVYFCWGFGSRTVNLN